MTRLVGDKEGKGKGGKGNGDGNKGGGQVTTTATKRVMATAMRVVDEQR